MNNETWISLWRWARRRHTNRSAYWVKDECFPTQGARRWRFSGAFGDVSGTKRVTPVFLASSVHFQPHSPIRSDANPFDPERTRIPRNDAVVHLVHELRSHLRAYARLEPGAVKVAARFLGEWVG